MVTEKMHAFKNQLKQEQKLNIMVTENNAWLKTNESKTETEHNGDWKNAWYKANELKAETEHNGDWNNTGIKPLQEKQKMNIMVTEIMHAKKPMNAKNIKLV